MAAILAFSAVKNNDQIGLLLFSDQVEHFVPPRKGRGHVHRLLRDLYYFKPNSHRTNLSTGLQYLQGFLKKRATVFVMSDFMDQGYEQSLRQLGKKHDVIACVVADPFESVLPDVGVIDVQDAETGQMMTIDTSDEQFRQMYQKEWQKQKAERDRQLRIAQVDQIEIINNENFIDPLVAFFRQRRKR